MTSIPEFSKKDFLESDEPYKYLAEIKEKDEFKFNQVYEYLKNMAKKVGAQGFRALWKSFERNNIKNNTEVLSYNNETKFDGQRMILFSGPYICNDSGVCLIDLSGRTNLICLHPIMPIRRLVNMDTRDQLLEIAFKKGSEWRFEIVERYVIADARSILRLAAKGVSVNSENAKALSTFLITLEDLNFNILPENMSVSRLGWMKDMGFAPYANNIIFDGESMYKQMYDSVSQCGDLGKWLNAMRNLREKRGVGRIFLAASFASVLVKPLGLLPFFVHAYGETEVGKTVGLMIAASVWANPKVGEYITSFNATSVGMEMTATFLNNLPMCIDELQIQDAAGIKDYDSLIYRLCEGRGKTRGTKTGGIQQTGTWACCFISTGERPITNCDSKGGAMNRTIEFECSEKIYDDLPGLCDIIKSNYGYAGKVFIEYLQIDSVYLESIKKKQKECFADLIKNKSMEKQAASIALILAVDDFLTTELFCDDNHLSVNDFLEILKTNEEISINKRAYEFLSQLPIQHPKCFYPDKYYGYQGECWGKVDGDYIYILKPVFNRLMKEKGFNPDLFLSWAHREDLLRINEDGNKRHTMVTKISNKSTRCVALKAAEYQENQ